MNIVGIIPARMNSSRFPGKPLAKICGMPMIGHVYHRSKMAEVLEDVYVATCDLKIVNHISSIGGKAIMTANTHDRASDRTAEALLKIEEIIGGKVDIVVMIQGDEPMVTPEMIKIALQPLLNNKALKISNLYSKINTISEFEDPNEVKVVIDKKGFALYFSREAIPSRKKGVMEVPMYKQVCVMPFKRDFLIEFNNMKQTPLEIIESVDMMRILENGTKVKMIYSAAESYSVDTQSDLTFVEKLLKNDNLIRIYNP